MPPSDPSSFDLPGMVLRLAGEAGQVSLARTADSAGARAIVDQHAAEIREALAARGRPVTTAALLSYARGFAEAAIGRGWWPPHRPLDESLAAAEAAGWGGDLLESEQPGLDWESLRLAAICRMLIEVQGLGL
jgi:hypothetical protein